MHACFDVHWPNFSSLKILGIDNLLDQGIFLSFFR